MKVQGWILDECKKDFPSYCLQECVNSSIQVSGVKTEHNGLCFAKLQTSGRGIQCCKVKNSIKHPTKLVKNVRISILFKSELLFVLLRSGW